MLHAHTSGSETGLFMYCKMGHVTNMAARAACYMPTPRKMRRGCSCIARWDDASILLAAPENRKGRRRREKPRHCRLLPHSEDAEREKRTCTEP
jgi:hypothetical protein